MGDPVTTSLLLKAGSAAVGGVSAFSEAQASKEASEINAFIGRTRAMQSDTSARQGLESELGNMRAVLGANADRPSVGTIEIMNDLRENRNRERRITFGNAMQQAYGFQRQAAGYGAQGTADLALGLLKAGPSIFDLFAELK